MKARNSYKEIFKQKVKLWKEDIKLFAKDNFDFEPDEWQAEAFERIANSKIKRISIKSGQGVGKTAFSAIVFLWFLTCFPNSRVVATAPTRQQLNDVLWAELEKWRQKSPFLKRLLKWTKTYVYVVGREKRWFGVARASSKPENMQGFHEDNMLFIIDEASGVPDDVLEAVRGTLSGVNNKLLLVGNPTKTTGMFYDSHTSERANWSTMTVDSALSKRTNKENIQSLIDKYGADSNVVRVRVHGEFPLAEDDVFIPISLIEKAIMTESQLDDTTEIDRISLGVDVARFGDDETVIYSKIHDTLKIEAVRHGQNLMRTVGDIVALYHKIIAEYPNYHGIITANIDDTGLGGGVTDRLEEVKEEQNLIRLEIVPVNFASKPPEDDNDIVRYNDITSYMWGTLKDLMIEGKIHIENDDNTVAQISARKYTLNSSGKIALEPKKAMKERGISSPDRGDAIALAVYERKKIYSEFIKKIESMYVDGKQKMIFKEIYIGVASGGSTRGASFVCTGIKPGKQGVVVLASINVPGEIETDKISSEFVKFVQDIKSKYALVNYIYCNIDEIFLYKCIKSTVNIHSVPVRGAMNDDVVNRVRLTTRLQTQGKFALTQYSNTLAKAFMTATWQDNKKSDTRSESSDVGTLSAFEYTIERLGSRYI